MVKSFIRRNFTFMFCCADFFVNMFRFRINKWKMVRYITDKNTGNEPVWFGHKHIIYQSYSLVRYSRRFGNYLYEGWGHERIKKVQCVFVIIIFENIKIEISTQNNFVITISINNTYSSSHNLYINSIALALGRL